MDPEDPRDDHDPTRWSMIFRLRGPEAERAWRWFAKSYRPFVTNRLRSIARNHSSLTNQLDDLVETFWGYAWRHRLDERADPARSFRAFLFGCLRRYALSHVNQRLPHVDIDELELPSADASAIDDASDDEWAANIIDLAVREIASTRSRWDQAVVLYYGIRRPEQLSLAEVGAELDAKDPASLLKRAREVLRKAVFHHLRQTVEDRDDLGPEMERFRRAVRRLYRGLWIDSQHRE